MADIHHLNDYGAEMMSQSIKNVGGDSSHSLICRINNNDTYYYVDSHKACLLPARYIQARRPGAYNGVQD